MLMLAAFIMLVIGLAGIILGFIFSPLQAWLWLLVGWLVFSGITNGMLAWAAVLRTAQTRWSPAVNRLGHSVVLAVPVSLVVMGILLFGVQYFAPWVEHPIEDKEAWLNIPFMVVRDLALFVLLMALYTLLVRWSLIADAKHARNEPITERDHYRLTSVAVASVLAYVITSTIISLDYIMSLSPRWISTMFGPYYFITNLYAGMAATIVLGAVVRRGERVREWLGASQFQDMGNLMLGFGLFAMGLFFAQYLTIWYGDLPTETFFLIVRYDKGPWPVLAWTAFMLAYAIPFILLQSRYLKRHPKMVSVVAVVALVGFAIERYVLVVPSIFPRDLAMYPLAGLVLLAFFGLFILVVKWFYSRYSPVSAADEVLPDLAEMEAMA